MTDEDADQSEKDAPTRASTRASVADSVADGTPASPPKAAQSAEDASALLSPVLRNAFLLRATAICAVIGAALSVLIAPGLPGNASGRFVEITQHLSETFAYLMAGLLMALICTGAFEIARAGRIGLPSRILAVGASGLTVALSAPALREPLLPFVAVLLAVSAAVAALAGAWHAIRKPHTRLVGAVLLAFAVAALLRIGAWELAGAAGERGSARMWDVSCGIASAAVVIEGVGQLAAAAWLGTRGRLKIAGNLAIAAAFLVTWGAAYGVRPGAAPWQSILHSALADAPGQPPPFGLAAVATFLASAGIFLAFVAVAQRGQVIAVVSALALALISRGTLDVPLRAMAIAAAGQWVLLAMLDERAMWKAMAVDRDQRVAEERAASE